jgi:hypothetical protein
MLILESSEQLPNDSLPAVLKGQATTKFSEFYLLFPSPLIGTDHPATQDHPVRLD